MDQYIGKMLDNRYEILERIGTGGMAIVYKAKCHRLNRLVAIKILKSDLAQNEEFRRRFNAESQAVAQLSHPNIVSVYDVSRGGDMEYIVMELIDGITLKQYMEKRGQLNWRESLHFITQIMRGLSHAHSRGIIHRDIKPQNIMVLRDGSVKVADFGIPRSRHGATGRTPAAIFIPPAWCFTRCSPGGCPLKESPPFLWPSSTSAPFRWLRGRSIPIFPSSWS